MKGAGLMAHKSADLYKVANQEQGPFTFLSQRERALMFSVMRALGGSGTFELTITDADFEASLAADITSTYDPAARATRIDVIDLPGAGGR